MNNATPFASNSITLHVFRGVVGIAAIYYALKMSTSSPMLALALGAVALIAFRGCPMCWTIGLVDTISRKFRAYTLRAKESKTNDLDQ